MNPIANAALARALSFPVSAVPPARPKPAPAEPVKLAVPGKPERPKHFDQVGFRDGARDATDLVMSMTSTLKMPGGKQQIIERLKSAASNRPASQALGVWHVIELIEGAA
jgi:hypothetical protein